MSDLRPGSSTSLWVEAVEWLPTGSDAGLLRVRGRFGSSVPRPAGEPALVIASGGSEQRHASLPEPIGGEPEVWRGAFVVGARLLAPPPERLWVEWPNGLRADVPVPRGVVAAAADPAPEEEGGEVIDRAVLAERRARRAEAAEQAQARIAREALKAVEALELRGREVEDQLEAALREHDVLQERIARLEAESVQHGRPVVEALEARLGEVEVERDARPDPGRHAGALEALARVRAETVRLRVALRTSEAGRAAAAVRLASEQAAADATRSLEARLRKAEALVAQRSSELVDVRAELQATRTASAAGEVARVREAEAEAELALARAQVIELEAELARFPRTVEADLAALRSRSEALEADLAATRTRSTALEAELATARHRATTLEAEVGDMLRAFDAARARLRRHAAQDVSEAQEAQVAPVPPAEVSPPPAADPPAPAAPPIPAGLAERARAQEEAAVAAPAPAAAQVAADLEAAAGRLKGPVIVGADAPLPRGHITGSAIRRYPPLRGALVKLAHDDPRAAAHVMAGLLPAQGALLGEPVDYDVTIAELGTFSVTVGSGRTWVAPIASPRPRTQAGFHLRGDALALAELLAGSRHRIGRRLGRARASGSRKQLHVLQELPTKAPSFADLVAAGARLDPEPALRALAYAVPPAWTHGHLFVLGLSVDGATVRVTAANGIPLHVEPQPFTGDPVVALTREEWNELLSGGRASHPHVAVLAGWLERLQAFPA